MREARAGSLTDALEEEQTGEYDPVDWHLVLHDLLLRVVALHHLDGAERWGHEAHGRAAQQRSPVSSVAGQLGGGGGGGCSDCGWMVGWVVCGGGWGRGGRAGPAHAGVHDVNKAKHAHGDHGEDGTRGEDDQPLIHARRVGARLDRRGQERALYLRLEPAGHVGHGPSRVAHVVLDTLGCLRRGRG